MEIVIGKQGHADDDGIRQKMRMRSNTATIRMPADEGT